VYVLDWAEYIPVGLGWHGSGAVALGRGFGVLGMRPWDLHQLDRCGERETYPSMQRGGTRREGGREKEGEGGGHCEVGFQAVCKIDIK
jgi:hypothetical protein